MQKVFISKVFLLEVVLIVVKCMGKHATLPREMLREFVAPCVHLQKKLLRSVLHEMLHTLDTNSN